MEFFLLINVKRPTFVGILTFMGEKNSILGLSETEKAEFLDSFILMSILEFHAQPSLAWKKFITSGPALKHF